MNKAKFLLLMLLPLAARTYGDDFGMLYSIGAEKKLGSKWEIEAGAELRNRNNSRTLDRWELSADASYKILKGLKIGAGYSFLYDNNEEKITYHSDGSINNWRPNYWGARHRFRVDLTGSVKPNKRWQFQLRERWQYTYRPSKTTDRYDMDNQMWDNDYVRDAKAKNILRSRLQVKYDIPKSKFEPFANAEMFNAWSIEKIRYHIGISYTLKKQHVFEAAYRYQHLYGDDNDNEHNRHMIGLAYKYKF